MPNETAAERAALALEQAEADATNQDIAGDGVAGGEGAAAEPRSIMDTPPAERIPPSRSAFDDIVAARRRQLVNDGLTLADAPQSDEEAEASRIEAGDQGEAEVIADGREGDDAPAPAAARQKPAKAAADAPATVKIKVYGEERELPLEEVKALAQRAAAGDLKFNAAEATLAEVKKLREMAPAVTSTERTDATPVRDAPKAPASEPASDASRIDVKKLANDIQIGDPETAEKALTQLLEAARAGNKPVSDAELEALADRKIEQRLAARQVVSDYESDLHTIASEYAELFEDNDYAKIAGEKVHDVRARELVKLGYPQDDVSRLMASAGGRQQLMRLMLWENSRGNGPKNIDVFREVANTVVAKFKIPLKAKPAARTDPKAPTVDARPRRIAPQPPASATARAPGGPTPAAVPTPSMVVQEMRKARGQMN